MKPGAVDADFADIESAKRPQGTTQLSKNACTCVYIKVS